MSITPIVQFGTSRFLQAHVDLFVSEALERGQALGPITVVQSSGDAARATRLAALSHPEGFPVRVEGIKEGESVRFQTSVTSVRRTLSTATDWDLLCQIVSEEAEIILSNTSDAGWKPHAVDGAGAFNQAMSYPAKLTHLLWARYQAGRPGLQVMPTELVPQNGAALRELVLPLAASLSGDFGHWVATEIRFVNSLVDRIVSAPLEPAGAVAEPYALWAIEDAPGLIVPCSHPAVQVVPSLEKIEALKLFILNLGHTYLVENWIRAEQQTGEFVRDLLADRAIRSDLERLYTTEILPAFQAAGWGDAAQAYIPDTLDRLANPYLDHRLADIAQNHAEKVDRRIGGFLKFSKSQNGAACPTLSAILRASQNEEAVL